MQLQNRATLLVIGVVCIRMGIKCFIHPYSIETVSDKVVKLLGSKDILGDFSLICELNCYQTIYSPICL